MGKSNRSAPFSSGHPDPVLVKCYRQLDTTKNRSLGKRETWLRDCSYQSGLWELSWLLIDTGARSPLVSWVIEENTPSLGQGG